MYAFSINIYIYVYISTYIYIWATVNIWYIALSHQLFPECIIVF